MELICPECMGTLETTDGKSARCTVHGGEFQILFSRWQTALQPRLEQPSGITFQLAPGAMCFQHPTVSATGICQECGTAVCTVCLFDRPDGATLCLPCLTRAVESGQLQAPPAPVNRVPVDARCVQHPAVAATQQCQGCGA